MAQAPPRDPNDILSAKRVARLQARIEASETSRPLLLDRIAQYQTKLATMDARIANWKAAIETQFPESPDLSDGLSHAN